MNKEQLKHIFENSACLSPKQLRMYASGKMVHEEAHAAEMHLLSCPFCNDAVEGLVETNAPEAYKHVENNDASFLAQHIDLLTAQEELNKDSGSKKVPFKQKPQGGGMPMRSVLKPVGIAAGVLLVVGIFWFMRDSIFPDKENQQIAQNTTQVETQVEPVENETFVNISDTLEQSIPVASDSTPQLLADVTPIEEKEAVPTEEKLAADNLLKTPAKPEELEKMPTKNTNTVASTASGAVLNKVDEKKKEVKEPETVAKKSPEKEVKKIPVAADEQSDKYAARLGNSYEPKAATTQTANEKKEEVQAAAPPPAPKKIELGTARSGILKGDEAFNEGKYKKALRLYQKVMFDPQSNQRDAATLMAAKCHIAMEEKMQAETLLNSLIKENSTKKDEASGLLNKLGE